MSGGQGSRMSVRDTNSKDHICEGSNGNKDSPKSWTADIYVMFLPSTYMYFAHALKMSAH